MSDLSGSLVGIGKDETVMTDCMVGKQAPLFQMLAVFPDEEIKEVSLQQNIDTDKWTVLIFYPMNFTKVCPTEITAVSDRFEEFQELDAHVFAVSTDSVYAHLAWIHTPRDENGVGNLLFPLASDANHEVSRKYGVLIEEEGVALRGLFIISPEGELQYATIFHNNIGRDVDETLRVLQALQTGGLCPADWRPGDDVLY